MIDPHLPEGYDYEVQLGVLRAPDSDDYSIPDLFVAPQETLDTWDSEISPVDVLFVAEVVSPSSQTLDRVAKRDQYARPRSRSTSSSTWSPRTSPSTRTRIAARTGRGTPSPGARS